VFAFTWGCSPFDAIRRNCATTLRQIKDHEVAVVFNAVGKIVFEEHGGGSSVDLGPYLDQIKQVDGATLVHNHPLGWRFEPNDSRHAGSSFSPEDIATACYAELAEVRAVGPRTGYSMRPAGDLRWNGDYWINAVEPTLKRHKASVIRSTLQAVSEHRTSREAAEARFWHEVWQRVANDLLVIYQRFQDE